MRILLIALTGLVVAACDGSGGLQGGGGRQGPGEASELVEQMAARGRLPQRDYLCSLAGGAREEPYGVLGVATDRYTLVVKGGGREEGQMTMERNASVRWDGDLGRIDDDRRVTSARLNSSGGTLELVFAVSPALDGHERVICRAEA
jgi:hypothetical protein